MGDPTTASRLLLAETAAEAEPLAATLEVANRERRSLTDETLDAALASAMPDGERPTEAGIVVVGDWPVGIVGLVAGRLAERSGLPAVVVTRAVEPWRASARAPAGLDLAAAFDACATHLYRHGGHPQAAGCELRPGAFDAFRSAFLALAAAAPRSPGPSLALDLVVAALEVDYRLQRELASLDPLGPGLPRAIVGVSGLVVSRARPANGGHAQLTLRKGREVIDGIAFERPDLAEIAPDTPIDLVGHLGSRSFGGFESLQIEILDAAPVGRLGTAPADQASLAVPA